MPNNITLKENDLLFAKVKEGAIIPTKNDGDAGYDIYPCFPENYMYFKPHETKLVPTGIASALDDNYYIQTQERGSTGSKGVKYGAGVIDASYRGEWFIVVTNTNSHPMIITKEYITVEDIFGHMKMRHVIHPYDKAICQAVVHKVPKMSVSEVSYDELLTIKSNRGTGSLGSSNK